MKQLFNYRNWVLSALGTAAFIGIFAEPAGDMGTGRWLLALLLTKAAGLLAAYTVFRLAGRWAKQGKIKINNLNIQHHATNPN